LICGYQVGSWLPHASVRIEEAIDYDAVYFLSLMRLFMRSFREKERLQKKHDYEKYLMSSEWAKKRMQTMDRDNWKCVICGNEAEVVHHLTYERIFNESLNDLVSLCTECHQREHLR
tara:strand:- start:2653 stop:3003 length:351 start_codon:yes stop_codon:yes gene_type:complete